MKMNIVLAACAVAGMCVASAAQTSDGSGVLDNKDTMKSFYSDAEMKTLKTGDEFMAAMKAMTTNDRDKLAKECQDAKSPHDTFCQSFNEQNKTN